MTNNRTPDRETFQQFLANAFTVQESQMDGQFLSGITEVQRLFSKEELGLDDAMLLIVESARTVAQATGAAIGLLDGDQLTYRAGSGCSARHTGNTVTASLTMPSSDRSTYEILRVENAETDNRIEGSICRQFGVQSILILPVYRQNALGGVLEILFREAHAFENREVRAYRLLTNLIESAILKASSQVRNEVVSKPVIAGGSEPVLSRRERLLAGYASALKEQKQLLAERCGTAFAAVKKSSAESYRTTLAAAKKSSGEGYRTALAAAKKSSAEGYRAAFAAAKKSSSEGYRTALAAVKKSSSERRKAVLATAKHASAVRASVARASTGLLRRTKAVEWRPSLNMGLAAGAVVFGLIFWFAYGRGPASSSAITPQASASESVTRDQPSVTDAAPRAHRDKPAPTVLKQARLTRPTRAASGNRSEVEHFGSDVTVRHFNTKPPAPRKKASGNRVAYIGEDVTVHYFNAEPGARPATR